MLDTIHDPYSTDRRTCHRRCHRRARAQSRDLFNHFFTSTGTPTIEHHGSPIAIHSSTTLTYICQAAQTEDTDRDTSRVCTDAPEDQLQNPLSPSKSNILLRLRHLLALIQHHQSPLQTSGLTPSTNRLHPVPSPKPVFTIFGSLKGM